MILFLTGKSFLLTKLHLSLSLERCTRAFNIILSMSVIAPFRSVEKICTHTHTLTRTRTQFTTVECGYIYSAQLLWYKHNLHDRLADLEWGTLPFSKGSIFTTILLSDSVISHCYITMSPIV